MTRDELLAAFEATLAAEGSFLLPATGQDAMPDGKTYIDKTLTSLDAQHEAEAHVVSFWDNVLCKSAKATFVVVDRDTANEQAKWPPEKNPRPDDDFNALLRDWLNTKIADGTIMFYEVTATLSDVQRARATVLLNQAGDIVEKQVGIQYANETWNYKVVQA